ncbi:MAG: DUF805 domain-containing protein [Thiobacillus sp.]|nr:DUF805 domain-containing protein [Thiobacillus sp.]
MNTANPYQVPRSNVDYQGQIEYSEVKALSVSGRLGRIRYLTYSMGYSLLFYLVAGAVLVGLAAMGITADSPLFMGVLGVAYVGMIVVMFMITIQRAHDFDKSGWWSLLSLIPFVNFIFLFMPGTDGENRYGKKTPPNRGTAIILIVAFLGLIVIGILAAIAIPAYQEYVQRAQSGQQTGAPDPLSQPE